MDEQLGKARRPEETCEEEIIGTPNEKMDSRVASVCPALLPQSQAILELSKIPASRGDR
jgi:hypothetical protein